MSNNVTYKRLILQLLKDHEGEWIVISKGKLIGLFESRLGAINTIKTHDLLHEYNLVSPIITKKRKVTLGFGRKLK